MFNSYKKHSYSLHAFNTRETCSSTKLGKLHTEKSQKWISSFCHPESITQIPPTPQQSCWAAQRLCPDKCFSEEGYQKDVKYVSW